MIRFIPKAQARMIVTVELKRRMASTHILSFVVCKFYYEHEFCLIIILSINKSMQIGFHCAILHLSMAVCLQIKYSEKLSLNTKEVT